MPITYDPVKRDWTLRERGIDFEDAAEVFADRNYRRRDDRYDYSETRFITIGFLRARMVVVVWTPRGGDRHVISMRKANEREKARYGPYFETDRQQSEENG
jgi:uncharacterized DUF497 family protein